MSAEPRCRYCDHLWRWHHDHIGPRWCTRCPCDVWGQPPAHLSPAERATIEDAAADATEAAMRRARFVFWRGYVRAQAERRTDPAA